MGIYLLRRAGYDERFVSEVARTMEYKEAYEAYKADVEVYDRERVSAPGRR